MNKPVAIEMEHLLYRSPVRGTWSRHQEFQSIFRMGSDSIKPKYNLELFHLALSVSREG